MERENDTSEIAENARIGVENENIVSAEYSHKLGPNRRCRDMVPMLLIFLLMVVPTSYSQTLEVSQIGVGRIYSKDRAYINPNKSNAWPMPDIEIKFQGGTTCQTMEVDIQTSWTDPYTGYKTSSDTGWETMPGNDTLDVAWGFPDDTTISEGGTATVTYTIDGLQHPSFIFYIVGENVAPSNTTLLVDDFYNSQGAPWFWGNILEEESSGRQFFASSEEPLVVGNPDGIGISQIDGKTHGAADSYYWNYKGNIVAALNILDSAKSGAYTFWSNQVSQSNETPVPTNTTCKGSYFSYPQTGSWNYEDAEWIQAYNGAWPNGYFIAWNEKNYPNEWHINYPYLYNGTTYDYVHSVCNAASY